MSRTRYKAVTVRLNEYEWNSLEERIEESGQNKQSYMINALLGAEIAPKEEINTWKEIAGQFSELIKQLRGIATNNNQIAHKANAPQIPIKLTRVGVTGVKKLIQLERTNKRPIILLPTFDAFVDLPNDQKGVHMSRSPEAISEVLENVTAKKNIEVETICAEIVEKMMTKHRT